MPLPLSDNPAQVMPHISEPKQDADYLTRYVMSVARGAAIGSSMGVVFHAVAGGGLRALGRKTLTLAVVGELFLVWLRQCYCLEACAWSKYGSFVATCVAIASLPS